MFYHIPIIYDDGIILEQDEVFGDLGIYLGLEPGILLISNYGKPYNCLQHRFIPLYSQNGYLEFYTMGKKMLAHRGVGMVFVSGRTAERDCINHIDGVKSNNYYMNLEWCTKAENNRHAYATHLNNCIGENCRSAKLTNAEVHEICKLLQNRKSIKEVLSIMGMEDTMNNYEIIRSIRKGYAWRSISQFYDVGHTDYIFDSIPDDEVHKICQCFEMGMSIKEAYRTIYGKDYGTVDECDKYNILRNIHSKHSHKSICSQYNF